MAVRVWLQLWLQLCLVAIVVPYSLPEGLGATLRDDDLDFDTQLAELEFGEVPDTPSSADSEMESLPGMAANAKERVMRKRDQAARSKTEATSAALVQAKADPSNEPKSEVEAQQNMDSKGKQIKSAYLPSEPSLSIDEESDFEWGVKAAESYETAGQPSAGPAVDPLDDVSALEKEVELDEDSQMAADRKRAAKMAREIRRKQEQQAERERKLEAAAAKVAHVKDSDPRTTTLSSHSAAQGADDGREVGAVLKEAMNDQDTIDQPSTTVSSVSRSAAEAIQRVKQRTEQRANDAKKALEATTSSQLEAATQRQEEANLEAQSRMLSQEAAIDHQVTNVGHKTREELASVANLAGMAQSAADVLAARTDRPKSEKPNGSASNSQLEAKLAEDEAAKAQLKAQIAAMKAQAAAGAPSVSDKALVGLQNKLARIEGQVSVLRSEERAARGDSARTAELLAREHHLLRQAGPKATRLSHHGAEPAEVGALIRRVDALEKALFGMKEMRQSGGGGAHVARDRALEARMQLLERQVQDLKAHEDKSVTQSSERGLSALMGMRQELQHDDAIENELVQGVAQTDQVQTVQSSAAALKKSQGNRHSRARLIRRHTAGSVQSGE